MTGTSRNYREPDEWRDIAQGIADRVLKGPGSSHARVLYIRDLLVAMATENYEAGRKEGEEKTTLAALENMAHQIPLIQAAAAKEALAEAQSVAPKQTEAAREAAPPA